MNAPSTRKQRSTDCRSAENLKFAGVHTTFCVLGVRQARAILSHW